MTTLLRDLGIQLPILQAPMAGAQDSAMAIAVSSAGGLGALPSAMLSAAQLHSELVRLQASGYSYNLNFFCHQTPTPDRQQQLRWQNLLAPHAQRLGVDLTTASSAPARAPFSAATLALIAPFKPPVLSFHFGLPAPALLQQARNWGARILSSATTVAEARWLAQQGVDAIIAQGLEAGGHRGHFLSDDLSRQMGTLALLPQIVAAVDVPVIAAGGIADAPAVAAALALGASAVQAGTAYLLCDESRISPVHRNALQSAAREHTALTNLFTGRPARGIVNHIMRELGPLHPDAPAFPLATNTMALLRAAAEADGSGDFSPLWSGQNNSGCRPISAAQLTRELALTER